MTNPLILKLEARDDLSDAEKASLENAITETRTFRPGDDLVREGDRPTTSTLVLDGLCARYKLLGSGRRQITAINVPGDFVDLQSFLLHEMDHGIVALTPCRVGCVPHDTLRQLTEAEPHLTRLLWLSTVVDSGIHRQWLVAMGRMSAQGRMAHLVCELYVRLRSAGCADDLGFDLPITQEALGDILGLSSVHVNRVLQELRGDGLITWRGGRLTIGDWDRLRATAEFDPNYLNLIHEPR